MATLRTSLGCRIATPSGHHASHAVAEDVGLLDFQVLEQGGGVVRHLLGGERTIDVGGVPVPL